MDRYMPTRNAGAEALLARLKAEWESLSRIVADTHGMTFADRQTKLQRMKVLRLQIDKLESTIAQKEAAANGTAARSAKGSGGGGFMPVRSREASQMARNHEAARPRAIGRGFSFVRNGQRIQAQEFETLGMVIYEPIADCGCGGYLAPRVP